MSIFSAYISMKTAPAAGRAGQALLEYAARRAEVLRTAFRSAMPGSGETGAGAAAPAPMAPAATNGLPACTAADIARAKAANDAANDAVWGDASLLGFSFPARPAKTPYRNGVTDARTYNALRCEM